MRRALIPLCLAFDLASNTAFSQGGSEPASNLNACSSMEPTERVKCLNKLSQSISPPAPGSNWVISETISPVDYTPVVLAVTSSQTDHESSALQLLLACRGGRTELIVAGPGTDRPENYTVSYRINDGGTVLNAVGKPFFGTGIAFKADVVRLLLSLPDEGYISVHLAPRTGPAREGQFSLSGLKVVREKLAAACKWPQAIAGPRN
jgi:hypothetical protein